VLAKNPLVLSQEVFTSPELRKKAFYAEDDCLIFCGDVREVLGWLREAGVLVGFMADFLAYEK
jgi:hypothetical protein